MNLLVMIVVVSVCRGKNKCAAIVRRLVGSFAALLFLRSVGLFVHVSNRLSFNTVAIA